MRYIIRFALFIGLFIHNTLPLLGAASLPDTSKRRIDTVYITTSKDQVLKNYAEILEKTNQQLGVWSNPYGIMIAALGVLFTIATIIAAVIFYIQSRDFQSKMNQLIAKHDELLNGLSEKWRTRLEEMDKEAAKQLDQLKSELKKAPTKMKSEIRKAIATLEKNREEIENQLSEPVLKYQPSVWNIKAQMHKCKYCRNEYHPSLNQQKRSGNFLLPSYGTCPSCGKDNWS